MAIFDADNLTKDAKVGDFLKKNNLHERPLDQWLSVKDIRARKRARLMAVVS